MHSTRQSSRRSCDWLAWPSHLVTSCLIVQMQTYAARRRSSPRGRTRYGPRLTANPAPDDAEWLRKLVRRSPLLADRAMRQHWERVLPVLQAPERYTLAAILLDIEHACQT